MTELSIIINLLVGIVETLKFNDLSIVVPFPCINAAMIEITRSPQVSFRSTVFSSSFISRFLSKAKASSNRKINNVVPRANRNSMVNWPLFIYRKMQQHVFAWAPAKQNSSPSHSLSTPPMLHAVKPPPLPSPFMS